MSTDNDSIQRFNESGFGKSLLQQGVITKPQVITQIPRLALEVGSAEKDKYNEKEHNTKPE